MIRTWPVITRHTVGRCPSLPPHIAESRVVQSKRNEFQTSPPLGEREMRRCATGPFEFVPSVHRVLSSSSRAVSSGPADTTTAAWSGDGRGSATKIGVVEGSPVRPPRPLTRTAEGGTVAAGSPRTKSSERAETSYPKAVRATVMLCTTRACTHMHTPSNSCHSSACICVAGPIARSSRPVAVKAP